MKETKKTWLNLKAKEKCNHASQKTKTDKKKVDNISSLKK